MENYDFIFDAKEANRRTTDLLSNNNKEILQNIFNEIAHSISIGEYCTIYFCGEEKNDYIANVLIDLGYKVEWLSDKDDEYMLIINWED